jgi:hypothetical protein
VKDKINQKVLEEQDKITAEHGLSNAQLADLAGVGLLLLYELIK